MPQEQTITSAETSIETAFKNAKNNGYTHLLVLEPNLDEGEYFFSPVYVESLPNDTILMDKFQDYARDDLCRNLAAVHYLGAKTFRDSCLSIHPH